LLFIRKDARPFDKKTKFHLLLYTKKRDLSNDFPLFPKDLQKKIVFSFEEEGVEELLAKKS
jgi:hypothetical protein